MESVGQPEDQPHLAAARLAAQIVEIAAVEPVDDADQPQARAGRLSQRMSMTRPVSAPVNSCSGAPAGLYLLAQLAEVGGDRVDDAL